MNKTDMKNLKSLNSVVTIGFFDGMHLGHQKIINTLVFKAKENNYQSVVITFDDSILSLFKMASPICSFETRVKQLKALGVDKIIAFNLHDNFKDLDAKQFIETYLRPLNTKIVICGSDFSFAKNKQGNAKYLKENTNYQIINVDDVYNETIKLSSTYIRNLLLDGKIEKANNLIYSKFNIQSKVISGLQIGRKIGYKTANLEITNNAYILKHGVYFGIIEINNVKYKTMVNIGLNPTINDSKNLKIECHILNFEKDIYNQNVNLELYIYHREEIKFDDLDKLKRQLEIDLNCLNSISL